MARVSEPTNAVTVMLKGKYFTLTFLIVIGFISVVASAAMFLSVRQERYSTSSLDRQAAAKLEKILKERQELTKIDLDRSLTELATLAGEYHRMKDELARLTAKSVVPQPGEQSTELAEQLAAMRITVEKVASHIDTLDKQTASIDERMLKIESVILADPQKVLELPLLKRDLQTLQQQLDRDINALRGENTHVYDLMKWLIGLMALVSLSLIGAAVGNIFRGAPSKEAQRSEPTREEA
ncbi:MAG: hypothetical protein ABSF90_30970 [Syntrophobacteraceae bacterium]